MTLAWKRCSCEAATCRGLLLAPCRNLVLLLRPMLGCYFGPAWRSGAAQLARGLDAPWRSALLLPRNRRSGRHSYYASIGTACAATRTRQCQFGFARRRRQLLLNDEAEALADLFPLRSAEARSLVDRLDAGEFDHDDDEDLAEINTLLSRLDERDQRSVTRAYWVLRAREHPPEDFDAFANVGPPHPTVFFRR